MANKADNTDTEKKLQIDTVYHCKGNHLPPALAVHCAAEMEDERPVPSDDG